MFSSEFGALIPNWTDEPGFDSEAGAFAAGLQLGFDITTAVRIGDGETFNAIPPERIRISAGGEQVDSPGSDTVVPGLVIGAAGATSTFHHHAGFELLEPARCNEKRIAGKPAMRFNLNCSRLRRRR